MSQHHAEGPSDPPGPAREVGRAEQSRRRPIPLYRLVLLHNAANDLMFVVRTVMELIRFCRDEATHKMWQAHHTGRSVLLITYRERAELYAEQFASKGLSV